MSNKPIKSSYSILLMRDDCAVSTFRLRAFWIKAFIITALLLLLLGAAGIYGAYHYYGRYQTSISKRDSLQAELNATRVELQDRKNLAILPDGDEGTGGPYSVTSIVQRYHPVSTFGAEGNAAPGAADGSTVPAEPVQPDAAAVTDRINETAGTSGAAAAGASASDGAPNLENSPSGRGAAGAEQDQPPALIKVSNAATSFEAGNKMRVNFDIANLPQKGALAGTCAISAVTRQGTVIELTPVSRGSLSFRIERFRRMQTVMILPGDLKAEDIVSIKIAVRMDDQPVRWTTFPVTDRSPFTG